MASLNKRGIIAELSKYGINIKSVQQLNKILSEMGILDKIGSFWHTTEKGLPFSIYRTTQVLNGDLWHETIVKVIAKHLGK